MIFSDGECPSCDAAQLHLNTSDFFECPQCHLVCACIDGLIATIMPWRGEGNFRFEDCDIAPFRGVAFAKSKSMTVIPDVESIFYSRDAISNYIGPSDKQDFTEGENLSPSFLFAFRDFILNCSIEELQLAWSSKTARTRFYTERVMPAVAKKLGLLHGKEEFKVDFVMTKESFRGHSIPKIYIESENNYEDASHEIRKLCSINSPLRYLITVTNKKRSLILIPLSTNNSGNGNPLSGHTTKQIQTLEALSASLLAAILSIRLSFLPVRFEQRVISSGHYQNCCREILCNCIYKLKNPITHNSPIIQLFQIWPSCATFGPWACWPSWITELMVSVLLIGQLFNICWQNLLQQVFKRTIAFDHEQKFPACLRYSKLQNHSEKGKQ